MLIDNLRMAEAVCAALTAQPVAQLVYISSDAVYADDANPVTERSYQQPSSLHGVMHLARETMLRSALKLPLAILRPTLIYGAEGSAQRLRPEPLPPAAAKGEAITLFGEGEEMRDHVPGRRRGRAGGAGAATTAARACSTSRPATRSRSATWPRRSLRWPASKSDIRGTPRQNPITHRHFDITDCLKAFPEFHYSPLSEGLARVAKESA